MTKWLPDLSGKPGPRYRAIADAIADDIRMGRLPPGHRLPTHRELAWTLGVTVGTVTRAYKEVTARGLVDGEIGRGTFVRERRTHGWGRSADDPAGPIDFGLNFPPMMDTVESELRRTLAELAADPSDLSLAGYDVNGGRSSHREAFAGWLAGIGVAATPETTLITSGAQHAISTALQTLAEPGDIVLCDRLTHPGFLSVAANLHLRLGGVEGDGDGMLPDALDAAIRLHRPKAVFLIPTIQNPTASVMPNRRRREIVDVLDRHACPGIEDDIYRPFAGPAPPPPLAHLLPERILYLTSVSKHLAPGLRVGALHLPTGHALSAKAAIRDTIWMATPLTVEIAARWMRSGTADRLSEIKRVEQQARVTAARTILGDLMAPCPDASPHIWVRAPESWQGEDPSGPLLAQGVRVTAGGVFAVAPGSGRACVRLALGRPQARRDTIQGLEIVAKTLARHPSIDRVAL